MFLEAKKFDVRESRFPEYLIVLHKDPSTILKDIFNCRVTEITGERWVPLLLETQEIEDLLAPPKVGDMVKVISGEFEGCIGVVEYVFTNNMLEVLLTLWGQPYKIQISPRYVKKL